jgi:hypothetical protein
MYPQYNNNMIIKNNSELERLVGWSMTPLAKRKNKRLVCWKEGTE